MDIIDGHTHIGKWSKTFFNYKSGLREGLKIFRESGLSGAVCMPSDAEPNEKLLREILKVRDFKIYFCAWIRHDDSKLLNFIDKNIDLIKFFKFHPSLSRKRITDKVFEKFISIAEDCNKPVIVHCGRWQKIAGYQFPLKLARLRPRLKIILAHLGGAEPSLCLPCAEDVKKGRFKNVYLGTESVREFYFVNKVVKIAGPDRIIFGSDYNLCLPKTYLPIIESLKISPAEKELIYSGNISGLMNI